MAAHANSTPAPVFHFPSDRPRPAKPIDDAVWHRCFVAASVSGQFRGLDQTDATTVVCMMLGELGAAYVARILDENAAAISALRGLLAALLEDDRRITAAADAALARKAVRS